MFPIRPYITFAHGTPLPPCPTTWLEAGQFAAVIATRASSSPCSSSCSCSSSMPSAALSSELSPVDRWELAVALLVGAGLAGGCYLYSAKWGDGIKFSASGRPRRRPEAVRLTLQELQMQTEKLEVPERWVAVLGTAFDVSSDPFFDSRAHGVYALWANHDVTNLLLEMGVNVGLADDEASMATLLDVDSPFELVDNENRHQDEDVKEERSRHRRIEILIEWYARFHTRYAVVTQISDLFTGPQWDKLRDELTPADGDNSRAGKCPLGFGSNNSNSPSKSPHGNREAGGKCPLGFGSRSVARKVSSHSDLSTRRIIAFQGMTYDVTDSAVFQEGGTLAHFVGHDVTYALACQSNSVDDLNVSTPPQGFSYEQQVVLEQYRVTFNREFPVVEDKSTANTNASVDLHAMIDRIDRGSTLDEVAETVKAIQSAVSSKQIADIDSICIRTTMTPLHKAVEKNQLALVRVLVEAGADIRAEASLYDNETPLEMADRFQFDQIAKFLSDRM